MTESELEQYESLRREMDLCSLGDRPPSISASKLQRLIELERIFHFELGANSVAAEDAELNGILMLIAHQRDQWANNDMKAAAALDELHRMIREGAHKPYVDAYISENQEV